MLARSVRQVHCVGCPVEQNRRVTGAMLGRTYARHGELRACNGADDGAGWDWLGITPNASERIGGVIEVPALAASLTLNKGDFIRSGARGAAYLA